MAITAAQLVAKVSVEGADKTKSELRGVGDTVGGLSGFLKSALSAALTSGLSLVGDGLSFLKDQLVDSVKVAMQHQQVMQQTAQALKSTGDVSGMTARSIADLADKFSQLTPFSEDTTQSAENLLLTFTGIGKNVFPQATQAILDMSQAMGQDTKSSAIMLGKALNDPLTGLTALTRVGVTFSDKEKEQIKTMMAHNNIIGAQKIMLHELQTEFGGSATAAGKTFGGQLAILGNQFEDIKIKVGTALLPVLSQFTGLISSVAMPILDKFGSWFSSTAAPALDKFAKVVGSNVTSALKQAGPMLENVGHFLASTLLPPAQHLASVLVPLAKGVAEWATKSGALHGALDLVRGVLSGVVTLVGGLIDHLASVIGYFEKNKMAAQILGAALLGVGTAIAAIKIGQFIAALPELIGQLVVWATGQWAVAAATIATALPYLAVGALIALVVAGIVLAIQHWGQISKWLQDVWHTVSSAIGAFFSGMGTKVHDVITGIGAWFSWLGTQAHDKVAQIIGFFGGIVSFFESLPGKALQWGEDLIQNLINGVKNMLGNLGKEAQNVAGTIAQFIHFSKPDIGPLADSDRWMADLGDLLSTQLRAQSGKLAQASLSVAQSISPVAPARSMPAGVSALPSSFSQPAPNANQQSSQPIYLQIDGHTFAKLFMPYFVQTVRNGVGIRF